MESVSVPYEYDSRFSDVLQLPSQFVPYDFDKIYARPFNIEELHLINSSKALDTLTHTLRAIDMVTSINISELTDGDLAYLMAWLRLYSYPKAPTNAIWQCKYPTYFDAMGKYYGTHLTVSPEEIKRKGLVAKACDKKNVYLAHGAKQEVVMLPEDHKLPAGVDFPRVKTLLEAEDLEDDNKMLKILPALRCIKEGETLEDKHKLAREDWDLFLRAQEFSKKHTHGVIEIVPIECLGCNTRDTIRRPINIKTFLYGQTEESIYDMQYNLMSAFNINPDDKMPSKRFLYHHACFVKDMRERKEKQQVEKENRKKNKGR